MNWELTQKQWEVHRAAIDARKERLAHEKAKFEENCRLIYLKEGPSEILDKRIDNLSVLFTETASSAQEAIDGMEELLADATIIEEL